MGAPPGCILGLIHLCVSNTEHGLLDTQVTKYNSQAAGFGAWRTCVHPGSATSWLCPVPVCGEGIPVVPVSKGEWALTPHAKLQRDALHTVGAQ